MVYFIAPVPAQKDEEQKEKQKQNSRIFEEEEEDKRRVKTMKKKEENNQKEEGPPIFWGFWRQKGIFNKTSKDSKRKSKDLIKGVDPGIFFVVWFARKIPNF